MTNTVRLVCAGILASCAACGGGKSDSTPTVPVPILTPSKLAVLTQPVGAPSGAPLATQPVIEIQSASGVRVTSATNTVTAAIASGSGTLGGTTTVTASGGVATFTNLSVTGVGAFALSFTSSGLTSAQSTSLTNAQGQFDALEVLPASGQVSLGGGQSQTFVVRAKLAGSFVPWPIGATAWTLSNTSAATITVVNDSTVTVTAATLGTTATVTLTAKLGATITSNVTFSVIAQAAAASVAVGTTTTTLTGTTGGTATLDVLAVDVNGAKVTGLTTASYAFSPVFSPYGTITVSPTSVSTGPTTSTGAFSAVLVIDQSGSMEGTSGSDPSRARYTAAKQFAQGLQGTEEAALFTFSVSSSQKLGFSTSASALAAAVDGLTFDNGGWTKLYAAGIQACQYAQTSARNTTNKVVILLTDGADNDSTKALGDLVTACNTAGVRVYAVGFGGGQPDDLERIANLTGGYSVFSSNVSAILSAVRGMPAVIRGGAKSDRLAVTVSLSGGTFPTSGAFVGVLNTTTASGATVATSYRLAWSQTGSVLVMGSAHNGTIASAAQVDSYTFTTTTAYEGFSAQALQFSGGFDADLRVAPPSGGAVIGGNFNDLGYQGSEWLAGLIPTAGTSTISVRSAAGTTGGYDLAFTKCAVTDGGAGSGSFTGTLVSTDCRVWAYNPYFAQYVRFTGTAGRTVTATLTSSAFDAFLYLIDPSGRRLWSDNDGGGGTNARISYTLTASGTYILIVSSYYARQTGAYNLTMTQAASSASAMAEQSGRALRPDTPRPAGPRRDRRR